MSFRDEEEALRARLRDAEGALAAAKDSLELVRKDAEDVPELRKRNRLLEGEVEELRRGVMPVERRKTAVAAGLVVLGLFALAALYAVMDDRVRAAAAAADAERRAAADRYAAIEEELGSANRAIEDADRARGAAEAERDALRTAPRAPSDTFTFPIVTRAASTTFLTTGHVSSASGDAPVRRGAECTVAVTLDGGDECRAQVLCGEEELYPRDGDGGFFASCEHDEDRNFVRGGDVATTELDGDPRIDVDRERGTAVIGEGPSPSWEVTIRFAASR